MVCTMELASRLAIGGTRRRLSDCCTSLGLDGSTAHTALGDAEAAAAILACYLERYGAADALIKGKLRRNAWPIDGRRASTKMRDPALARPIERSALTELIEKADLPPGRDGADETAYLALLERMIEDRDLDSVERGELVATASLLGIDGAGLHRLHRDYLDRLISVAMRDGEITAREREDLHLVGVALDVEDLEERMKQPTSLPAERPPSTESSNLAGHTSASRAHSPAGTMASR